MVVDETVLADGTEESDSISKELMVLVMELQDG